MLCKPTQRHILPAVQAGTPMAVTEDVPPASSPVSEGHGRWLNALKSDGT